MDLDKIYLLAKSSDYKERFLSEYLQLKDRATKLEVFIKQYENGSLLFIPDCPVELLKDLELS